MPNLVVSEDVDTLLAKSSKAEVLSYLGIATNSSDIATNASNIATNASNISTNATNIATNVTNIAGKQDTLTFGIANTNAVKIDNTSAAANSGDICKFAGSGIMPYTYADLKYDLGVDLKAPKASPSFTGTAVFYDDVSIDGELALDSDAVFNSEVVISGGLDCQDDVQISNGGLELADGDLELTAGNNLTLTASGKIEIGDLHISEGEIVINNDSELFRLATDERTLIGQGDETVLDWSSHDQTSFPASDAKVGIRKSNPSSALDVNGSIKANSINVNSQKFYVDPDDDYIKAGGYGTGDFSALTGSENQPKTTPAFGSGGKVVEKTFIKTIKLQGTGFTGLGTAVQIVAAPGAGKYNVPLEMTIFHKAGPTQRSGEWGSSGSQASLQIGTFQNSANDGNFAPFLTLPVSTAENTGDWVAHKTFRNIESKQFSNRDICIKALNSNYPSSEANAPDGEWYIRVEYMVIGESAGFENNVDQTIGTAF